MRNAFECTSNWHLSHNQLPAITSKEYVYENYECQITDDNIFNVCHKLLAVPQAQVTHVLKQIAWLISALTNDAWQFDAIGKAIGGS